MDTFRVQKSLVMPPPAPVASSDEFSALASVARNSPDRFTFLAGGRSLNPMIQEAIRAGMVSDSLRHRFEQTATAIFQAGAVGFGEMTALHLSFTPGHPYEAAPPDHPLFLLLADLSARNNLAIDLHMEAVAQDKPTHRRFLILSSLNPPVLTANISGFERLLAHNRNARIVWVHIGWDNTGDMTVSLLRRLLQTHANLFLEIKLDNPPATFPQSRPLDQNGALRPEWLELIRAFPDRFLLGSDAFYGMSSAATFTAGLELTRSFLNQLPPDLALKVGFDNAVRIYNLR